MHIDDTIIGQTLYGHSVAAAIAATPLVFVDFRSAEAHYTGPLQTVIDALWSLPVRAVVRLSPSIDLDDVILPRSVTVTSGIDAPAASVALTVTALPPRNRPGIAGAALLLRLTAKVAPWGEIIPASADSSLIAEAIATLLAGRIPPTLRRPEAAPELPSR